jgi:hypothetical protein
MAQGVLDDQIAVFVNLLLRKALKQIDFPAYDRLLALD